MANTAFAVPAQSRRRKPLAACVASLFALAAPVAAIADNWTVNSCDEGSSGGPGNVGTLRYALIHATSPAVIDLSDLTACPGNAIKLSTLSGELTTNLMTVTIKGPGATTLQIDASGLPPSYGDSRVLAHYGAGKLTIQDLGMTGGHIYHAVHPVMGGCIFSAGDIELDNSTVSSCYATSKATSSYSAVGGGIFAAGTIALSNSTVTMSSARAIYSVDAVGGGVYAGGTLTLNNFSSIGGNYAKANGGRAAGGGAYGKGDILLTDGAVYFNTTYSALGKAIGGGLHANGNASVAHAIVKYNSATSAAYRTYGGGAYVHGNFTLTSSQLYKNEISSANPFSPAEGGGVRALGNFFTSYSTISGNKAHGYNAAGGGLSLGGNVTTISSSTISGNVSEGAFGGVGVATSGAPGTSFQISSSTISGNNATSGVGGLYVNSAAAKFYNTTIAFNTTVGAGNSPGVRLKAPSPSMAVTLQNTLLSNNTYGTLEDDLDASGPNPLVFNGGDLATPAGNLIRVTFISAATLPGDTKQLFCPHLGALRDNGGLTKTHALLSRSVAIDAGSSSFFVPAYDQRGPGVVNGTIDYPRISGPTGNPAPKLDIGAYEVQQGDIVFNTDFEDCPPPPL